MGKNVGVMKQSKIDVKGFFNALFGNDENNEEADILTKEQLAALKNVEDLEKNLFTIPEKDGKSRREKYIKQGIVVEGIEPNQKNEKEKGIERE